MLPLTEILNHTITKNFTRPAKKSFMMLMIVMMIAMIIAIIMVIMIVLKQIDFRMFHGDATGFHDVDDDHKDGDSNEEFDIRKFHGDVVELDDVDDDYSDHDDDVFDTKSY